MTRFLSLLAFAALFVLLANAQQKKPSFNPKPDGPYVLFENFQSKDFTSRWIHSKHPEFQGKFVGEEHSQFLGTPGDISLVAPLPAQRYAISTPAEFDPKGKTLVVQYEVRTQTQLDCGGMYVKLLQRTAQPFNPLEFNNESPYVVMFGPDRCGATNKVHLIVRHHNPKTNQYEEKHLATAPAPPNDLLSHLFTLIIRPDNTFEILIDNESRSAGNLLGENYFSPPFNPPREIDDVTDVKPPQEQWDERESIADATDSKPADWDESQPRTIADPDQHRPADWDESAPLVIPDPDAVRPAEWDDAADGAWEAPQIDNPYCAAHGCGPWKAPQIPNPLYKGKWAPRMIPNPAYKGTWHPRKIPNPDFFENLHPANLNPVAALGIDIWTMTGKLAFDNFLITHDEKVARDFAEASFVPKRASETALKAKWDAENPDSSTDPSFGERFTRFLESVSTAPLPLVAVVLLLILVVIALFCCCCCCDCFKNQDDEQEPAPDPKSTTTASTPAAATPVSTAASATTATTSGSDTTAASGSGVHRRNRATPQ